MAETRRDEHEWRMKEWLAALQKEAAGRGTGTEMEHRFATLTLCQLARGDAKLALILADQLLDDARHAVEDLAVPAISIDRIPLPDYKRSVDRAWVLRTFMRQLVARARRLFMIQPRKDS